MTTNKRPRETEKFRGFFLHPILDKRPDTIFAAIKIVPKVRILKAKIIFTFTIKVIPTHPPESS